MGNTQNQFNSGNLMIHTYTWQKQSHQLFDYDALDYQIAEFNTDTAGFLKYTEAGVQYGPERPIDSKYICWVDPDKGNRVRIQQSHSAQEEETLWTVIQPNKQQMLLREGDLVKLGRVNFKVREIQTKFTTLNTTNVHISEVGFNDTDDNKSSYTHKSGSPQCRICFSKEQLDPNPLISPCNCSGSLKYIHLACLRDWLSTKIVKKISAECYEYSWKKFKCEVCHQNLKEHYEKEGRQFDIYQFDKPNSPYIVMEFHKIKGSEQKISVYVYRLQDCRELRIGRDQDSQIKINDISVSRNHCSLVLRNHSVYLIDKKSKFGTLVKFHKATRYSNEQLWLQLGRTLIKIQREQKLNSCCCRVVEKIDFEIHT